jgi:ribA/ribD-fused uncharacterized protein
MPIPTERCYPKTGCAVFRETRAEHGGLSNMASGFPLAVNGVISRTPEALYQACRFPQEPQVQATVLAERSPMAAKMESREHADTTRGDWDEIRVEVMRWVLRVKLVQHFDSFSEALRSTGDIPIVEESRNDRFWGAVADGGELKGVNMLGELLTELRDEVVRGDPFWLESLRPPQIQDFNLLGATIGTVRADDSGKPVHAPDDGQQELI